MSPFSTVMSPLPTCFHPVRSLPLNSGFHSASGTRAAISAAATTTTRNALSFFTRHLPSGILGRKHISHHEPQIRRALREAPHKPWIPVAAVSHQYNGAATSPRQAFLLGTLNSVEHLHFQVARAQPLRSHVIRQAPDERDVVR